MTASGVMAVPIPRKVAATTGGWSSMPADEQPDGWIADHAVRVVQREFECQIAGEAIDEVLDLTRITAHAGRRHRRSSVAVCRSRMSTLVRSLFAQARRVILVPLGNCVPLARSMVRGSHNDRFSSTM